MINGLLQYSITHILGFSLFLFSMIYTGILIRKFTKKYDQMEIFWIPWWLVIGFIMGSKFI